MRQIYRTDNGILSTLEDFDQDIWVNLVSPDMNEIIDTAKYFGIDVDDMKAALDVEESSRVQLEDGYTMILVDIPSTEVRNNHNAYTTIPLAILLVKKAIITVCAKETPILTHFSNNMMRGFSTKKKMRFVYQILLRTTNMYQAYLRVIDKRRSEIEKRISDYDTEEEDLIHLHELETNLVYFATSLSANRLVLDRLTRYERIKQYPEDKELLDDVIIENRQAIEMTNIYRDVLHGSQELVTTIINNRLNDVMKFLTGITLVMAIPTIISGIYGMNVSGKWMPLSSTPYGFYYLCGIIAVLCVVSYVILKRKKLV